MEEAFYAAVGRLSLSEILRLHRGRKMGAWLSVVPFMVNRTEIGYHQWRDDVLL